VPSESSYFTVNATISQFVASVLTTLAICSAIALAWFALGW
jgi:hypothetical protein